MSRNDVRRTSNLDLRGNVSRERVTPPAHGAFVWGSLIFVWLISLLPWRMWEYAPDVLLITLAFWCVNQSARVGLVAAFVFGILMDVHDSGLLGELALTYVIVAYGATVLNRRLQRFDLLGQAIHLAPVFLVAKFLTVFLHAWMVGHWPGWGWAVGSLLSIALFPIWGWVLHMPFRGDDDRDAASA